MSDEMNPTHPQEPEEIGKWLDQNQTFFLNYFLKKADMVMINQWLVEHGYVILCEGTTGNKSPILLGPPSERRGSRSTCSSRRASGASVTSMGTLSPTSNPDRGNEFLIHPDKDHNNHGGCSSSIASGLAAPMSSALKQNSNSKKTLRNDFAKAKSRSVFQNEESSHPGQFPASLASRRSSLKDMRKYTSLPPNSINILSLLIESKVKLPRYASKHFEWKRELRKSDDRAFFLDIVKDIANDLDLCSLTKKITDNMAILLDAEAASLFIIQGARGGKQTLVSKVWDVPIGTPWVPSSTEAEGVEVSLGAGILGWVAERGEVVNLEAPSQDPRYKKGMHPTHSLLAMPIRSPSSEDEVIAVAQVVNKNPYSSDGTFTHEDQKMLETYLQFVGIALTNAQIMEATRREYERNRNLLEVVHDLFEEQTSLESVILKIMQRAQRLLKCERASVLLLDENTVQDVKFSKLFELNSPVNGHSSPELQKMQSTDGSKALENQVSGNLLRLAEQVVGSGEVINIAEIVEVERGSGGNLKSLLAMPIRNRHSEIIGVATIVNKLNNIPFDEQDEQLFEAFTIFCGLGINNTLTYGELERAIARQKVAIEVLSYHASASIKDVEPLLEREVPEAKELDLMGLDFDDFSLNGDSMILASLRMFIDLSLVSRFKMDNATLIRWLLTVQRNYRDVPYHNWRHAFNVAQVMFATLTNCEMKDTFSELEVLAMFVACLCHDLDHRGTNNSFQAKTGSALSLLYGTQNTMEHHHFNHAGHNIFSGLSQEEYSRVMNVLKQCILATDLTIYFKRRNKFFSLVSDKKFSWEEETQRETLRCMLMTASDLAASTKKWSVQSKVAELVTAEFFAQGDQERKQLQITPLASMDREREGELPQLQMRWIHDICLPLYQYLSDMNPRFSPMRDGARENMKEWAKLAGVEVVDDELS